MSIWHIIALITGGVMGFVLCCIIVSNAVMDYETYIVQLLKKIEKLEGGNDG